MLTRYDILAIFIVTLIGSILVMTRLGFGQTIDSDGRASAIFAAGCFWCIEKEMESVEGVYEVVSGYTGGDIPNPSYEQVSSGTTGHREAVRVVYDPSVVSFNELLDVFWNNIDPLNSEGQFCDIGIQYMSAIFYQNEGEKLIAEQTRKLREARIKQSIVTDILPAAPFYEAEEYHQDFYKKNPFRYGVYRAQCGRDERLQDIWGQ